jgi:hypothetical protein
MGDVRLKTGSSRALRDGIRYLRVEERAGDMVMTSKDGGGGGGGGGGMGSREWTNGIFIIWIFL